MQMLVCYARELKEGFAEYTEQVVMLMVEHLKFYYHDGEPSERMCGLSVFLGCGGDCVNGKCGRLVCV